MNDEEIKYFNAKDELEYLIDKIRGDFKDKMAIVELSSDEWSMFTVSLLVKALGANSVIGVVFPTLLFKEDTNLFLFNKVIKATEISRYVTIDINDIFKQSLRKFTNSATEKTRVSKITIDLLEDLKDLALHIQAMTVDGILVKENSLVKNYLGSNFPKYDCYMPIGGYCYSEIIKMSELLNPKLFEYYKHDEEKDDFFGTAYYDIDMHIRHGKPINIKDMTNNCPNIRNIGTKHFINNFNK